MIGLIGIAYAIKELGKRVPSFATAAVVLAIGLAFMVWFVRRQRTKAQPMIDFKIFKNHGFTAAVASAMVATTALIGMELVFTQRLQLVMGLSPLQAGLFILPLPLASFVSGPLTGHWLQRVGSQRMLFWALLVSSIGMGAYLLLFNAGIGAQIASLIVLGLGLGATMTAASSTIMNSASQDQAGMAASIEEVSFELGGAIGVTLMGSILSAVYAASMVIPAGMQVPAMVSDSLDEALIAAEGMSTESAATLAALARAAFDQGFVAVLAASALLLLVAAVVVRLKSTVKVPLKA